MTLKRYDVKIEVNGMAFGPPIATRMVCLTLPPRCVDLLLEAISVAARQEGTRLMQNERLITYFGDR